MALNPDQAGKLRVELEASRVGPSVFSEDSQKALGEELLDKCKSLGISSLTIRIKKGAVYAALPYSTAEDTPLSDSIRPENLSEVSDVIHKHFPGCSGAIIVYPLRKKPSCVRGFSISQSRSENQGRSEAHDIASKIHERVGEMLSGFSAPRNKPLIIECSEFQGNKSFKVAFIEINVLQSQKHEFAKLLENSLEAIEIEEGILICFHANTISTAIDRKLKKIAGESDLMMDESIPKIKERMHKISGASFSKDDLKRLKKILKRFRNELFVDISEAGGVCIDQDEDEQFPEDLLVYSPAQYVPGTYYKDHELYVCFPAPAAYLDVDDSLLTTLADRTLSIFSRQAFEPIATHESLPLGWSYNNKGGVLSIAVKYTWGPDDPFIMAKKEVMAVKARRTRQISFEDADAEIASGETPLRTLAEQILTPASQRVNRRVKSLNDSARLIQVLMEESKSALGQFCKENKILSIYRGTEESHNVPSIDAVFNSLGIESSSESTDILRILQAKRRENAQLFLDSIQQLRRRDRYSIHPLPFKTSRKSEDPHVDVKPQKISGVINGRQILTWLHNFQFPMKQRNFIPRDVVEPVARSQSKKERRRGSLSAELEFFASMIVKLSQCGEIFSGTVVGEKEKYYLVNIPEFTHRKSGWYGIVHKKKASMSLGDEIDCVLLGWNNREKRYEFSSGIKLDL